MMPAYNRVYIIALAIERVRARLLGAVSPLQLRRKMKSLFRRKLLAGVQGNEHGHAV